MKARKVFILLALVLGGLLLLGFWSWLTHDYVVTFPNGYQYFAGPPGIVIDRGNISKEELQRVEERFNNGLYDNDDGTGMPRVGPHVDRYFVYSEIIIGHVSPSKLADDEESICPPDKENKLGYFIIDMRTDRLYNGLSKGEWLIRLRKYGITHEPKLYKPSRFDAYFGRNKPKPLYD